jgi:hypothetical protein
MNPLDLIAAKQPVGREYASEAELFVLCHFDAAKRGLCTSQGYNFISRHLCMAYFIGARLKSRPFMELTMKAGDAWRHAGDRPTATADLTTGEYNAIRAALKVYFRALPKVEVGTYRQACNVADKIMQ